MLVQKEAQIRSKVSLKNIWNLVLLNTYNWISEWALWVDFGSLFTTLPFTYNNRIHLAKTQECVFPKLFHNFTKVLQSLSEQPDTKMFSLAASFNPASSPGSNSNPKPSLALIIFTISHRLHLSVPTSPALYLFPVIYSYVLLLSLPPLTLPLPPASPPAPSLLLFHCSSFWGCQTPQHNSAILLPTNRISQLL